MSSSLSAIPLADWHGPGWWVAFFPVAWFAFFFLIFFAFRRVGWWGCGPGWGYGPRSGRRAWAGGDDPAAILDRRFAEGRIDAEEYASRRGTLERPDP
jgi:putative membrane protein